jgi:hypothetical protein
MKLKIEYLKLLYKRVLNCIYYACLTDQYLSCIVLIIVYPISLIIVNLYNKVVIKDSKPNCWNDFFF